MTVEFIRCAVWPNGKLIHGGGEIQTPVQDAEMRELNKVYIINLLKNSYITGKEIENAWDKIQEIFDNEYLLKSIIYMLIDCLLLELFPELTGKVAGVDAYSF